MRLEDLRPNSAVRGVHPDGLVTVVSVQWFGSAALELTYKTPAGTVANELLYRHDEARLEVVAEGRPWSFDGDGALFRLVSEAQRIRLAHLFDPLLAVHTSVVDPLPHQITGVYEAMLPRQPLRFLTGRRPGRRQDHHGGPAHQGADRPRRPGALPHRLPRQPRRTVAGRAVPPVPASVRDPHQRQARSRPHPQLVPGDRGGGCPTCGQAAVRAWWTSPRRSICCALRPPARRRRGTADRPVRRRKRSARWPRPTRASSMCSMPSSALTCPVPSARRCGASSDGRSPRGRSGRCWTGRSECCACRGVGGRRRGSTRRVCRWRCDQRQLFLPVDEVAIGRLVGTPGSRVTLPFSSGRTGWSGTRRFGGCVRNECPGRRWRLPPRQRE